MFNYRVLAYYHFAPIHEPHEEVLRHKAFLNTRDATARIYISEQGINGQLCLHENDVQDYIDWMEERPEFQGTVFKINPYHEQVFPRLTIKYRKHLVAYDEKIDLSQKGEYASPHQWKEMLKACDPLLIDVRNDYEWHLGHFEGAESPPCKTFRDFETYAEELKSRVDPKEKPVMMYCTGGIRCELFSSILKKRGFSKVYQLEGGVINYGLKVGSAHWLGKLFVFDDRLSVPISDQPTPVIGTCRQCQKPSEAYYNCANMDCNELFLCCPGCLKKLSGCCQESCQQAPRLRPYHQQNPHKPFRRWHQYFNEKPLQSLKCAFASHQGQL